MRDLHVVTVSEDGRHVLLADKNGATEGGFRVNLDDRLAAAVRGDLPRPGAEPAGPELTPKEIQARLRAGESAAAIALSAKVPVTRIERFAGPVQGEMARMIDAGRSAYLVRGRLGRSAVPLGEAVDAALAKTPSVRPDSSEWDTKREEDGSWLVTVSWFARARAHSASWHYDPVNKVLVAADPVSAALGHVDPDAPVSVPKRRTAMTKATAEGTAKANAPGVTHAAKKAPAAKKVTTPAAKAAVKAPAMTPARAMAAEQTAEVAATLVDMPAQPSEARALTIVLDPDPRPIPKGAGERSGAKARAIVPGWADVLLGTSPGER